MSWWVSLWNHREQPTVLALLRIGVGLVLLVDFGRAAWLGVVPQLWAPDELGGLGSKVTAREPPLLIYELLPHSVDSAWLAYGVLVTALVCFTLGLGTRVAGLVALLTYAALAKVLPLGDRGIDLMMRNVLLVLSLSRSHAAWSLDARIRTGSWFGDGQTVPAWPRHLLILQLVVMYFLAGVQKTALSWTPLGGYSALYLVLQDPHIARFDMSWLSGWAYPLSQVATATTHLFEWTAPLTLLAYHYRDTAHRPGRLRAWSQRWRPHWWWIGVGALLHLGIWMTMDIGIFPWAMLLLYPAWFHPDELQAAWRKLSGLHAAPAPGLPEAQPGLFERDAQSFSDGVLDREGLERPDSRAVIEPR